MVLGLAFVWALFVPVADLLAHHDVGSATGPLHETALDNARGRLLTLGAGLVAAAALVFTALNFGLLRRNSEAADRWQQLGYQWQQRTFELSEQGQVTDRYTKAIEQLGSSTIDVTIGGIYALERVARDSPQDHPTVMEVLAAYIREHSNKPLHEPTARPDRPEPEPDTRPDVQAAVTVIGRRDVTYDRRRINLRGVHLPYANLAEVNLSGADLSNANLAGADLTEADLTGADLTGAQLDFAKLTGAELHKANLTGAALRANLTGANLAEANLTEAKFRDAYLTDADLTGTDLTYADLRGANLSGANLSGTRLTGAKLSGAKLIGAKLIEADLTATAIDMSDPFSDEVEEVQYVRVNLADADLTGTDLTGTDVPEATITGANLTGARWPEDAPVPEGWERDSSGRLRAAAGDS